MLRNEPLMFVQGPPVFIKVAVMDEESTSVFAGNENDSEVVGESDLVVQGKQEILEGEGPQAAKGINPSIVKRIHYLGSPFARQVYRPLQFVVGEETLKGTIEKIEGETLVIEMAEGEKEIVSIEMATIEEILWRGDPFLVE